MPASECSAANSVITHKPSGRTTTFGKVAEAAAKLEPPKNVKLKDPKDWKIAGKGVKRLDTPRQADRQAGLRHRHQDAGHADRHHQGLPGARRQGEELRCRQGRRHAGREEGGAGRRYGVAVVADTLLACAQAALEALPIVWDLGEAAKVSSASIAEFLQGPGSTPSRPSSATRRATPRRRSPAPAQDRGGLQLSLPEPRHHGADELHRALYGGRCEVWAATQNGEAALAAVAEESGLPVGKCDVHKVLCGGGFGRRGRVDYVRQAVQIAKQMPGTPVKLIWSREEDMTHCAYHPVTQAKMTAGCRRQRQPHRLPHAHFRPVDLGLAGAGADGPNGMDPVVFQGLSPNSPEGNFGYQIPNLLIDHAMRNTHILAGFWRGVNVNHNAIYSECFIDEVAHAARPGPAGVPAQDAQAQARRRAQGGRRQGRLGHAGAAGRLSRARPVHVPRQLCRGLRRGLGDRAGRA